MLLQSAWLAAPTISIGIIQNKKSGQLTIADRCALIFDIHRHSRLFTYIPIESLYTQLPISDQLGPKLYLAPSSRYGAMKSKTTHPALSGQIKETPYNFVVKLNMQIAEV